MIVLFLASFIHVLSACRNGNAYFNFCVAKIRHNMTLNMLMQMRTIIRARFNLSDTKFKTRIEKIRCERHANFHLCIRTLPIFNRRPSTKPFDPCENNKFAPSNMVLIDLILLLAFIYSIQTIYGDRLVLKIPNLNLKDVFRINLSSL